MQSGSCHCRKVVFEISDSLSDVNCCYCETCRKLSGGAYSVVARVPSNEFHIITGNESLCSYRSSPGKVRYYCKNCCSPIYVTVASQPESIRIRLGSLDFEPKVNIIGHIWVSQKPNWHDIKDSLPKYLEWPENP